MFVGVALLRTAQCTRTEKCTMDWSSCRKHVTTTRTTCCSEDNTVVDNVEVGLRSSVGPGVEDKQTVGARTSRPAPPSRSLPTRSYLVDMASALLRRQLARNIGLSHRRFLSRSSPALAQSTSQDPTTATHARRSAYAKHIAEDLQGVTASEILAESGTRKDAQMRHFTGRIFLCSSRILAD